MFRGTLENRIAGLDGLRAISISMVIFWHLQNYDAPSRIYTTLGIDFGMLGVEIFFTISGFLITWLLLKEEKTRGSVSFRDFYVRRAFRILPPALAYLVMLATAEVIIRGSADWKNLVASALFYRNLFRENFNTINTIDTAHYWTLAVEEQFYLVWPLLFVLLKPSRRVPFLVVCLLAMPLWRQLNYRMFHAGNVNPARGDLISDCIVAGCLLACAMETPNIRRFLTRPFFSSNAAAVVWATALAIMSINSPHLSGRIENFLIVLRAAAAAMIVLRVTSRAAKRPALIDSFLNAWPIVIVGQLSYSLYLWQEPFCMRKGIAHFQSPLVDILASLCFAEASWILIERPSLAIRKSLSSRTAGRKPVATMVPA